MTEFNMDEYRRDAANRLMAECNALRERVVALRQETERFAEDHADFQRRVQRVLGRV